LQSRAAGYFRQATETTLASTRTSAQMNSKT
jgi:hypothetical protein